MCLVNTSSTLAWGSTEGSASDARAPCLRGVVEDGAASPCGGGIVRRRIAQRLGAAAHYLLFGIANRVVAMALVEVSGGQGMKARAITVAGGVLLAVSTTLVAFLAQEESGGSDRVLTVYADKLAQGLPTVCNGLTKAVTKEPIVVGETWSDWKCEVVEADAIYATQVALAKCFTRTPPQSVFDAASSHAWNFGPGATCGSDAMRAWNRGEWALGCQRLEVADDGRPVWSFVKTGRILPNGKPEMRFVRGLAARRGRERGLCYEGVP